MKLIGKKGLLLVLYLAAMALALFCFFGFFGGGKVVGKIISDLLTLQFSLWMMPLCVSILVVGILAPRHLASAKSFEIFPVSSFVFAVIAMVILTFIMWAIIVMMAILLGEFGNIFSRFISDIIVGFNSNR